MKKLLILTAVILLIIVGSVGVYASEFKDKITVSAELTNINLTDVVINKKLGVSLNLLIDNKSKNKIKVKNIKIVVSFKGDILATTSKQNVLIKANSITTIENLPIEIKLDDKTFELVGMVTAKKDIPLDLHIKFNWYFIPISFSTKYTYKLNG